ncbi:MAG: phosphotransferase [Gammaproteobacteria bacterium]|nr:phosphotransferase [Gammaproteobacteria bacterium]
MIPPQSGGGARDELRRAFLAEHCRGWREVGELRQDASARRYFCLRRNDERALLMDASPGENENAGAFVAVTGHLQRIGARVPEVYAADIKNGFLFLEDLGERTFSRLFNDDHENAPGETALYRLAVGALTDIRGRARAEEINLPAYDAEAAWDESRLFTDWYLPARMQKPFPKDAAESFRQIWREMLGALPPLAPTLVLRDFHIDNLILAGEKCALLDYQDALLGSPAYDLASLLEDARRDIAPELADEMMNLYFAQSPGGEGESENARRDFHRHYIVWAAQRHCKIAGIFTRLWLRDGKDAYLRHLPRVLRLLRRHLHKPPLAPLREWLAAHLGEVAHADFAATRENLLRHCAAR